MEKLLTVAIPTYNRAGNLEKCLTILCEQAKAFDSVEVLVSDNCSQDDTQARMQTLCARYPFIRYIRNEENIGPDRNFLQCYDLAQGEYALLLGDDDYLLSGAVESILRSLEKKPVALFLNNSGIAQEEPLVPTKPRWKDCGDIVFDDRSKAFEMVGIYATFVSTLVLNTALVRAVANKEQYIDSYFMQTHITLATMKQEGIYVVNTKNALAATANVTVPYDVYYVWFESYHKLFTQTAIESGFDEKILNKVYKKSIRRNILRFVIEYRRSCANADTWNKQYVYDNVKQFKLLKTYAKILVNCPKWTLPFFLFFHRALNKILR